MERLHSILNRINTWLDHYLRLPDDSNETILQKKIWWLLLVTGLPVLIILSAIIGNREGEGVVIVNYIWVIWFFSMGVIFHFHRKNIKKFAIVEKGNEVPIKLTTGFGMNGVVFNLYKNDKPVIETPKSSFLALLLVIIFGIIIGYGLISR